MDRRERKEGEEEEKHRNNDHHHHQQISLQQKLVFALRHKNAYPHKISNKIKVQETHISWVFLTGLYAYKIKKALKFGKVIDFSTLQKRRKTCHKELMLNKVLCGDMYIEVVKIIKEENNGSSSSSSRFKIVDLEQHGKAVEYSLKMRQMPHKCRMDNLITEGKVGLKTIAKLTETLVKFHHLTPTNDTIKNFGQPKFLKRKIAENFQTLAKLKTVDNNKFEKKLYSFIKNNVLLFYNRIEENRIRDIHGDLYLANIFIKKNRFYLYDRIEFNDFLRYADVAEDVAHLSMDLDYHKRDDLRRYFISRYITKSNDHNLSRLVYFFMCYKACVRAKVSFFRAKNERFRNKKMKYVRESEDHLKLAESYLEFL
jgi:aminoglycoside phosphotransferase family enzyme